jgi:branched-subunit amino acid aminotransferase/4-amino-4-deoxychorismate lyase
MLEGVMLSVDGEVVSGAVSNVFLVRGPSLVTPHAASGCRPGVTREVLLELAAVLSIPVEERRVEPEELASADELFFANTLMDCLAVSTFDGRVLPGGRVVTDRLRAALRARQAG